MYKIYQCFAHWLHGGAIYLYSDPHFGDEEMKYLRHDYIGDEGQIKRINSRVGKNDTIIFLGDIGDVSCIPKIRGYKVLVKGNHDKGNSYYLRKIQRNIVNFDTFADAERALECGQIDNIGHQFHEPFIYGEKTNDNHLFDEVYDGPLTISDKIILSHEPIEMNPACMLNIHGHCHNVLTAPNDIYHYNLCAEIIGYKPVALSDVIKKGALSRIDTIHRITIDRAGGSV